MVIKIGTDEIDKLNEYPDQDIWAVFTEEVSKGIDYGFKPVAYVKSVEDDKYEWLKEYWDDKYGIDVGDFKKVVGLIFFSTYSESERVYDYPISTIDYFEVDEPEDGDLSLDDLSEENDLEGYCCLPMKNWIDEGLGINKFPEGAHASDCTR